MGIRTVFDFTWESCADFRKGDHSLTMMVQHGFFVKKVHIKILINLVQLKWVTIASSDLGVPYSLM